MSEQLRCLQLSDQVEVAVKRPRSCLKTGPSVSKSVRFAQVVRTKHCGRKGEDHRTGELLSCCGGLGEHNMYPTRCPSVVTEPKGYICPLADGGVDTPWHELEFVSSHPLLTCALLTCTVG